MAYRRDFRAEIAGSGVLNIIIHCVMADLGVSACTCNEKIQSMYCQQPYSINYMIILRIFGTSLIQNLKQCAYILRLRRKHAEIRHFIF